MSNQPDHVLFADLLAAEKVAREAIREAETHHRTVLAAVRQNCPHDNLYETTWQSELTLLGSMNSLRICRTCGVEEEAQTFRILTGPAAPADRHAIYASRNRGVPAPVGDSRLFTD